MEEFLEVIIPHIRNETFVNKINEKTIYKKREEKRLSYLNQKLMNQATNNKKYIKIRRRLDNSNYELNDIIINSSNLNESYYIDYQSDQYTDLDEENKKQLELTSPSEIVNDTQKLKTHIDSAVYSDYSKYRGSNRSTDISTIIFNGTIKEIISLTKINLTKQEYFKQSDNKIYDSYNCLQEQNLQEDENNINVTNYTNNYYNSKINKTGNSTDLVYDLKDIESVFITIKQIININLSYYNSELIKDIYENYLDNFEYEKDDNSSLKILRALKNILPINDLNKYEIIKVDESVRKLEEENENSKYYGLKKISNRKNVFQTNLLGLDIALGIANTFYPSNGQTSVFFKLDLGDYKLSHQLKSYQTNNHIITENIQQMNFKMLQMMYLTLQTFDEQNKFYLEQISPIMESFVGDKDLDKSVNVKFSKIEDFYELIFNNKKAFQAQIDYFINNLTLVNDNLHEKSATILLNNVEKNLKNYINEYINNETEKINIRIESIKNILLEINDEIEKNNITNDLKSYLFKEYNSLLGKIKVYLNYDLNNSILKELKEGGKIYKYRINEKIDKIMNVNRINILESIINNNNVSKYMYSNEEKNYILLNLTAIKNFIQNNKTYIINSLIDIYDNVANIFKKISLDLLDIDNISIIERNNSDLIEEQKINEYFLMLII